MDFISNSDFDLSIRLPVGYRYLIANAHINRGDSLLQIITQFFSRNGIPETKSEEILASFKYLLQIDQSDQFEIPLLVLQDPSLVEGRLKLLKIRTAPFQTTTLSLLEPPKFQGFIRSFQLLTLSPKPSIVDALRQLEESYVLEVTKLLNQKSQAMTQLNNRQSREMDQATNSAVDSSTSSPALSALVSKHVFEMESFERKWRGDLSSLMTSQKDAYRTFVLNFSSQEAFSTQNQLLDATQSSPSPSSSPSSSSSSLFSSSTPTSSSTSSLVTGFSKRFFSQSPKPSSEPSLSIKDPNDPLGTPKTSPNASNKPTRGTGSLNLEKSPLTSDLFTVALGSQLKSMHNVHLSIAPLFEVDKLAPPPDILRSLYSTSNLTALVFPIEADLQFSTSSEQELVRILSSHPEFHFDSFEQQLTHIRNELKQTRSPLQPGDFIVTRHSNFYSAHVIFHLVSDPQDSAPFLSSSSTISRHTLTGLCNILSLCSHSGVSTLTIPIFLLRSIPDAMLTSDAALRRAQNVVRAIKAYLVRSTGHCYIQSLRFILPKLLDSSMESFFANYQSHIRRIFQGSIIEK